MEKTLSVTPVLPGTVEIGISSVQGTREYQQDAVGYTMDDAGNVLAVLCDGMGGMTDGALASNLCVTEMCSDFQQNTSREYAKFLCREIHKLDVQVTNLRGNDGALIRSGTTLASVVVSGRELYWSSVGDSRIYIIRGDEIVCVTKDHNYALILEKQILSGEITEEEANNYPKKEALVSFIGRGNISRVNVIETPFLLEDGDCIVLCSDGLYRLLDENMLLQTVNLYKNHIEEGAEVLTATATCLAEHGQDNTTVVIIKYKE